MSVEIGVASKPDLPIVLDVFVDYINSIMSFISAVYFVLHFCFIVVCLLFKFSMLTYPAMAIIFVSVVLFCFVITITNIQYSVFNVTLSFCTSFCCH